MSMQFGIYEQVFLALAVFLVSFGLGLDLEIAQFKHFLKRPRQVILGVFAQVIIFPAASLAFVYIFKPQAPIALAILLVASCPGGSLSNYLTFLSRGNVAYSISLTLIGSLTCMFTTPLMMIFLGNAYLPTREIMTEVSVSKGPILISLLFLLILPLLLGLLLKVKRPKLAGKILRGTQVSSFVAIIGITLFAIVKNQDLFDAKAILVIKFIFMHNLLGLTLGFITGKIGGLDWQKIKSLSIEIGYQNTTPAIAVSLVFFKSYPLVSFSVGIWAVWQYLSGLILAGLWRTLAKKT